MRFDQLKRREFIALVGAAVAARVATRSACTAARDAGDRVPPQRVARAERASRSGIPQGAQ